MSIPAHKVIGDKGKPGQVVSSPMAPDTKPDVTLNDYIARKTECCGNPLRGCKDCPPPKKMTFDEWYTKTFGGGNWYAPDTVEMFRQIWTTALTEGKL